MKWIERKFEFGFPKEYFPFLVERLRTIAPRLEVLTSNIPDELLVQQKNGKWSVKEHLGHLTDLDALHKNRILDFISEKSTLSSWDGTNQTTNERQYNNYEIDNLLDTFGKTRNELIDLLNKTDESILTREALHPRLQQVISITDLLYFIAEHDLHHLTNISSLMRIGLLNKQ